MTVNEIKFQFKTYKTSDNDLPDDYKKLIEVAKSYAKKAYTPYSKFNVGAAVLLANNHIIGGNNQENAAYPSGLCAERVALFYANAAHPEQAVKAIAICASSKNIFSPVPIPPCGSCRQVIAETSQRYQTPIALVLYGEETTYVINDAINLLPLIFDKLYLSGQGGDE